MEKHGLNCRMYTYSEVHTPIFDAYPNPFSAD